MSAAAIRAIVSGIPRRLWSSKPLVMLQAFVDDSIARTGDRKLFLAAYVLTAEDWIQFTEAWDEALREEPAIAYFKMAEANGRGGCFRKLSIHQRNKKVFRMAKVVRQFRPHGLHVTVSISDFNKFVKPFVPYPLQTPYAWLCHAVATLLARVHERLLLKMKCDVIFDDHPGLAAKILPAWEMTNLGPESWREWMGATPTFRDDKEVLPLQAADLLAWHLRREAEDVPARDYSGILDLLLVEGAHFESEIGRAALERLGEQFRDHPTIPMLLKRKDWEEAEREAVRLFYQAQALHGTPFRTTDEAEAASQALLAAGITKGTEDS